ncbi:MAG: hypothetical protein Q6370_006295, partial [Candidatus Sigynarchaeota archaeon]
GLFCDASGKRLSHRDRFLIRQLFFSGIIWQASSIHFTRRGKPTRPDGAGAGGGGWLYQVELLNALVLIAMYSAFTDNVIAKMHLLQWYSMLSVGGIILVIIGIQAYRS